jgi:NAD(P)-dependent dehydrogenase (short-subunit alcohol dehydrogenase family)
MFSLAGLNALITGGTAGIGLATARRFAALCHFLAAPDCRYMTGQSIYADGGNTVGLAAHTLEALTRQ